MSYTDWRTEHTYNMLLNGRWHTGYTPDVAGQLDVERDIIKYSGMNAASKVLDFGCGNGLVTYDYHVMTGARLHGVTNNPAQCRAANNLMNTMGVLPDKVIFTLLEEDWNILPFGSNTYDIVVFTESPCHVVDKIGLFRELKRVLKPGGRIVGMDWGYMRGEITSESHDIRMEIERVYGVHLIDTLGYVHIGNQLNMPCNVSNYTPQWDIGITSAVWSYLRSKWYSWQYPGLLIDSPFKVDLSMINRQLVDAGQLLEKDEGFKLFLVIYMKPLTEN